MKIGSQWNLLNIHVYAQRAKDSHCTKTITNSNFLKFEKYWVSRIQLLRNCYCGCSGKMFNYRLSYLNLKNYIKDECSYDVQKLKYISQKKVFI